MTLGKIGFDQKMRKAQYTTSYHADQARSKALLSAAGTPRLGVQPHPLRTDVPTYKRGSNGRERAEQAERRGEQRALTNAQKESTERSSRRGAATTTKDSDRQ